jgi:hypothetical protein
LVGSQFILIRAFVFEKKFFTFAIPNAGSLIQFNPNPSDEPASITSEDKKNSINQLVKVKF